MTIFKLSREKFAKPYVEVDISKFLLSLYVIKGRAFRMEYEGLHTLFIYFLVNVILYVSLVQSMKKRHKV